MCHAFLDHYFLCDQIIGTTVASHIVSAEHGVVLENHATDVADVHGSKLLNKSDVQTENKVKGSFHPHEKVSIISAVNHLFSCCFSFLLQAASSI